MRARPRTSSSKSKIILFPLSNSSGTKFRSLGEFSNTSTGIITSDPYTKLKGVSLVVDWGMVWYEHNILGISFDQPPFAFSSLLFRPLNRILLGNSSWPLVWGCSMEAKICLIPNSVHRFSSCRLANLVPLSDTKCLGTPNRHTTFFHTKCWILWVVIWAIGSASIHLVKWSMVTMRYFIQRKAKGNGPKIIIPQVWKVHGLEMDRSSFGGAWLHSACFLHCSHLLTYFTQSSFIFDP